MSEATNPYLAQALGRLPGLLAQFDTNPLSPTFGMGDRYHWAWKLIDFGNGTFQGAAHGLARLIEAGLLPPSFSEAHMLRRIDALFEGARRLTRRNGSLEEAFPYESSFCVTALVAFDLLCAVDLLGPRLDAETRARYDTIISPMIRHLHTGDETHAFISNHLATAAAALFRWAATHGGDGEKRAHEILQRILAHQSSEGWFREYEGADPGYQTLGTYYLADIHDRRPDLELAGPLARSVRFLWHFAHPDGSFGGLYGSRNTRFFIPAGIESLAHSVPEAAALCAFMRRSIEQGRTVTVDVIDPPNLVPVWNAWCWAAALVATRPSTEEAPAIDIPCESTRPVRQHFSEAGLLIDGGPEHYQIVSLDKGGVFSHFDKKSGRATIDPGVAARDAKGRLYSSQSSQRGDPATVGPDSVEVRCEFTPMHQQVPRPWQFAVLRLACITVLRFSFLNALVKKFLVRMLITGARRTGAFLCRTISLGPKLDVVDRIDPGRAGLARVTVTAPFSSIHMASQGYWQWQDDAP